MSAAVLSGQNKYKDALQSPFCSPTLQRWDTPAQVKGLLSHNPSQKALLPLLLTSNTLPSPSTEVLHKTSPTVSVSHFTCGN